MAKTFLTAEWRKLIMANYVVPESLLRPYLPCGTELDTYNGQCYVSLVGFLFQETRLKGLRVPFHVEFEEVNLRFYVRRIDRTGLQKRGVVFIKELVPRFALSFVAKTFYEENYATVRMQHEWLRSGAGLSVAYRWGTKSAWHEMRVSAASEAQPIGIASEEEFFTEHYWGYTKLRAGGTSEYEVLHPRWQIYPVKQYAIDVDFGQVYGATFSDLSNQQPESLLLAEGSEVVVRSGARIDQLLCSVIS
ncbi:MAG TPA: DUF2071 domain-containing protein [Edaphobacter sp.]|jgi:uncharacterized protein YqjF (DUF2071 family)|nr:DUF2071 domain-containing protein [Edaphobacter sp.]